MHGIRFARPSETDPLMMQLRRYIAFLFLFVYLSATAGSSWTALTCTCAARHACSKAFALQSAASHDDASPSEAGDASSRTRHASQHGGAVCSCRLAAAEVESPLLAAPCCRHLHLNLELLLARCCDGKRCRQHLAYHLLSDELPVATLVDAFDPRIETPVHLLRHDGADRPVPAPRAASAAACGLRAPPVTV